jgi:2-hydroxychromene-2-carboxylate isomerase
MTSEKADDDAVRFYFSFRSPYSWIAFERIEQALEDLPVRLEPVPIFPPADFPGDPAANPDKLAYMIGHDMPRLCEAYGLTVGPPAELDVDWLPAHAMWVYAEDEGRGMEFGKAVYAARWSKSQSFADPATFREAATIAGLDPDATLAAGDDAAYQKRVIDGRQRGQEEDGTFGVPIFVYRGERFWGHDRIGWLVRAIRRANGLDPGPIPD